MVIYAIVGALAYLLGSIPFGYILVRIFRGEDVRQIGSGNIGATNVARKAPGLGVATLVLDAAKGGAAVLIAKRIAESDIAGGGMRLFWDPGGARRIFLFAGIAAVFAILGHVFPVWLKFKGGKGVATGVGVFVALVPNAVLVVLAIFAVIFALFRYVSLASIIATAAFPIVGFFLNIRRDDDQLLLPFMAAASLLIIAKHHENIRRLLAGTEHRLELRHR